MRLCVNIIVDRAEARQSHGRQKYRIKEGE